MVLTCTKRRALEYFIFSIKATAFNENRRNKEYATKYPQYFECLTYYTISTQGFHTLCKATKPFSNIDMGTSAILRKFLLNVL